MQAIEGISDPNQLARFLCFMSCIHVDGLHHGGTPTVQLHNVRRLDVAAKQSRVASVHLHGVKKATMFQIYRSYEIEHENQNNCRTKALIWCF